MSEVQITRREAKVGRTPGGAGLAALGGYNGDGAIDLVWANADAGTLSVWALADGGSSQGEHRIETDAAWPGHIGARADSCGGGSVPSVVDPDRRVRVILAPR